MTLIIRQATLEDLDAIYEIEAICFPESEAASKSSLEARINAFSTSFLVAEQNEQLIGFINGAVINEQSIYDELFADASLHNPLGHYQSIFGLDVLPEFRNQGIAAQLMNHMIDSAKQASRKGLILTCKEQLIHYYEKFGYKNQGVSQSVHGGAIWYDMLLTF